jgi:hypothetical protein
VLAQVFGQKDQEAEPQRARAGAAAGRGTGQTSGPRESNLPDDGQTTHKSAGRHAQQCVWHAGLCGTSVRSQLTIFFIANGRQRQEEKGRLMMTRGEAGTSKPASWSKKGQKMPCDARDNADGRGDEDEEDGEDGEGVQDDEDGEEDEEDDEDEVGEQQQQQQQQLQLQKQNPSDGGGLPQTQYRQKDTLKRRQTRRDAQITKRLLDPEHSLAFGVWKPANGDVKVCSKGIGISHRLRNDVLDTLFKGIKNATPAKSTFQHPAEPFFDGVLTRRLLMSLVRCMGHVRVAQVHSAAYCTCHIFRSAS